MEAAMRKAAYAIAQTQDVYLASLYTQAGVVTTGLNLGTYGSTGQALYATGATTANILEALTAMHRALDEMDAPNDGRWVVWSPVFAQYLKYAQIVDNTTGGIRELPNGRYGTGYLGNQLGFDHFVSNNVQTSGDDSFIMFGTRDAIAFAEQIEKMEAGRVEKQFGDYMKGLYVYGAKVVRPDHLGVAVLDPSGLTTG
jgi:P22 coat protein - gene protein 5.